MTVNRGADLRCRKYILRSRHVFTSRDEQPRTLLSECRAITIELDIYGRAPRPKSDFLSQSTRAIRFFFFSFLISSTPFALFHRPFLSLFYLHLYNTSLFLSLSKYILSNFVFVIYIFFCFLFHLFVCSAFLCGFLFLHLDMFLCFFIYLSIYRSFFFYIYVYFTCVFLRDLNISAVFWRCERTLLKRI